MTSAITEGQALPRFTPDCPAWCDSDDSWHEPGKALHIGADEYLPASALADRPGTARLVCVSVSQYETETACLDLGVVRTEAALPRDVATLTADEAEQLGRRLVELAAQMKAGTSR
ncbi:hypothetical protein GCM10009827_083990 [Dactylosporangium maewongense]|uniref:Uncharacterized protein n=1 Tax=Dactylosporangium maewongense TaxID=634393 RepID=A0ABP4MYM7_9ACTN